MRSGLQWSSKLTSFYLHSPQISFNFKLGDFPPRQMLIQVTSLEYIYLTSCGPQGIRDNFHRPAKSNKSSTSWQTSQNSSYRRNVSLHTRNALRPSSFTYTLTSMPPSSLFSSVLSSLTFYLYQSLISPRATGLQAVRTVWSTTGGCRHITSSGTVIIWLFYCWMCCWRLAWGESNIFFATKFLGEDSTAASCSEHRFPKLPEVLEIRTQAFSDCQTQS